MNTIYQWQWLRPGHVIHPQWAVEMREKLIAAGYFPFQVVPQSVRLDAQQHQIHFTGKVFRSRFDCLLCSGEVHVAIGNINRRAGRFAIAAQASPLVRSEYLENDHGCGHALGGETRQEVVRQKNAASG